MSVLSFISSVRHAFAG